VGQSLRIDRIRCDGFGMCAELLPEAIELDDWGYPVVRDGAVPNHLLELAQRAVDVCPVLALRLIASEGARSAVHPLALAPHTALRPQGGG
jgi:ferredoxin